MFVPAFVLLTSSLLGSNTEAQAPAVPKSVPFVSTRFARTPPRGEDPTLHVDVRKVPRGSGSDEVEVVLKPIGFDEAGAASWTTNAERSPKPFRDLLLSWNVATPEETGFCVEVRVAPDEKSEWSSWMYVGDWGVVPALDKQTVIDGGRIDTDYFRGDRTFVRAQARVRAFAHESAPHKELRLVRLGMCFSNRELLVPSTVNDPPLPSGLTEGSNPPPWMQCLHVPYRSQKAEKPEIAGRICSPTSLAMVLAYRGVDRPTLDVATRAFDAAHDIYGNWPRNIQAAFSLGVPGYLTRFVSWPEVHAMIADGTPLVLSIVVKEGELRGAPYTKTDGHLLVLVGFDSEGDCYVNDPAASDRSRGEIIYKRNDLEKVWLERGGTAYVLLPKP